jgi:hypothetical protein
MLLRSFLTVASGYVLCLMCFVAIMIGLGYGFFPEFVEFFDLDKQTQEAIMENNPETAISRTMFLSMIALTSIACMGVGWLVIKTAPFAHFPHAVFLAVLLFIYFLQMALADPPLKKSMTLAYMIAFPIAILIGAKWAYNRGLVEVDDAPKLLEKNAD